MHIKWLKLLFKWLSMAISHENFTSKGKPALSPCLEMAIPRPYN
jgi:hypothetical protein